MIDFFIQNAYWGMFLSALLAGSILPFCSEAVLIALIAAKLDAKLLILYATIGNVIGGMFNYYIGTFGRLEWIEKYLRIKREKIHKAQNFMAGRGAIMGFFAFLPIIGSAITVALGLMRANIIITLISMTIGKILRFILIAYGMSLMI